MAEIPQTSGLQDLASLTAAMGQGRLNGRTLQALLDIQRYNASNGQYATTSNNALNQAKFEQDTPGKLASQSVRGDIMANAQNAHAQGLPSFIQEPTSNMGPSQLFSDATRSLGGVMSRNALASGMASGPPPTSVSYPTAPDLPAIPEASALDSVLNGVSDTASIINALTKSGASPSLIDQIKKLLPGGAAGPNGGAGSPDNTTSPTTTPPQQGITPGNTTGRALAPDGQGNIVDLATGEVVGTDPNWDASVNDPNEQGGGGGGDPYDQGEG